MAGGAVSWKEECGKSCVTKPWAAVQVGVRASALVCPSQGKDKLPALGKTVVPATSYSSGYLCYVSGFSKLSLRLGGGAKIGEPVDLGTADNMGSMGSFWAASLLMRDHSSVAVRTGISVLLS